MPRVSLEALAREDVLVGHTITCTHCGERRDSRSYTEVAGYEFPLCDLCYEDMDAWHEEMRTRYEMLVWRDGHACCCCCVGDCSGWYPRHKA